MKALRILWLVVSGVVLLPLIVIGELIWLGYCMYAAKIVKGTVWYGFKVWWNYIVYGVKLNIDFVNNGLQ